MFIAIGNLEGLSKPPNHTIALPRGHPNISGLVPSPTLPILAIMGLWPIMGAGDMEMWPPVSQELPSPGIHQPWKQIKMVFKGWWRNSVHIGTLVVYLFRRL